MQIRPERPDDADSIRALANAAFAGADDSGQTEAAIVDALRAAGVLTLSLVGVEDGKVVGHAAFSPVRIAGVAVGWYGLGPVSVSPARQKSGIGQAVIRDGLARLQAMRADGCVVLGDPGYYSRFGFEADPDLTYGDAPFGYFRRLVFGGPAPKGAVSYHECFGGS